MLNRLKHLFSPKDTSQHILINAYCTVAEVPKPGFPHLLNARRDLSDPELQPHLNGFMNHLAQAGEGRMTQVRYHVIRHVQRVRQHVGLSIEAGAMNSFAAWAEAANAIVFMADGSVRDPQGRILLAATGDDGDPQAVVPYPPQAWQRKARSDELLAARKVAVPATLPPLVSEPELRLRTPEDVLRRMLALFVVAIRAESLAGGRAIAVNDLQKRFPPAFASLTDAERAFLAKETPAEQETTQFLWRYEAILVLQWALGLQVALPFADAICDVAAISRTVIDRGTEGLRKQLAMRPAAEILDALDLHYRLHWATRQAILKKTATPAGLNDGVLQERHQALNWLVQFEDRDWDEVDTPT
ncbi:DUF4272 domain-containing protein [Duganella violaceipulchra]|uniref:DUF4272 domain-containing protein n=1 Tax=Duganella violaceipulchra TaxID=2849652 RepID=A0AA41HGQ4_9BURK|nr:DUF4272 domain-containing protein [Duganella violaceicalia]MBV6323871.1 DUF4272 domain-containing protein [Duganella violaceicalia]MCP2007563.1 hypothetical protein [Duganella violaceicalia]